MRTDEPPPPRRPPRAPPAAARRRMPCPPRWAVLVLALGLACACQRRADTHLSRADELLARGGAELALAEYLEALRLEPSLRAERGAGRAYAALGEVERAERHLTLALSVQPGDTETRLALVELYGESDRDDDAKKQLVSILEDQPNHLGALLLVGGYAETPAEVRHAIAGLERAAERQRGRSATIDRELQIQLADLYARSGRDEQAASYQRGARLATIGGERETLALGRLCVQQRRFGLAYDLLQALLEQRPSESDAWLLLAQAALELGHITEARAALQHLAARVQRRPDTRLLRARIALAAEFQVEAEHELTRLLSRLGTEAPRLVPRARLALAQALLAQQRRDDAVLELRRLIAESPEALDARVRLARLELDQGNAQSAVRCLTPLPPAHPELGSAFDILGRAQLALGDSAGAESSFRQVVSLAPERPEGLYGVARALLLRGEHAPARPLLEDNLQRFPSHRPSLLALAELIKRSEGPAAADSFKLKYWATHATSAEVATLEGDLEYGRGPQQQTRALAAYRRAITLAPDHLPAASALARFYARRKLAGQAFSVLDGALAQSPNNQKLLLLAAEVATDLRDHARARQHLDRVLSITPEYPPALAFLARLDAESGGDLADARQLAERAFASAPGNAEVLDALGWLSHLSGDAAGAVSRLDSATRVDPGNPRHHYQLAIAALAGGDSTRARASLAQAFTLDPAYPDAAELRLSLGVAPSAVSSTPP
jgi:tetratricopeptide (TPR) repeat protein